MTELERHKAKLEQTKKKIAERTEILRSTRLMLRESLGFGIPIRDSLSAIAQAVKEQRLQPAQNEKGQQQTQQSRPSINIKERFGNFQRPRIFEKFFQGSQTKPQLTDEEIAVLEQREQILMEEAERRVKEAEEQKKEAEKSEAIKRARETISTENL